MFDKNLTAKDLYDKAKQYSDYTDKELFVILEQAEKLAIENSKFDIAFDVLLLSGKIHIHIGELYKSLTLLNAAFKLHIRKLSLDKYRLGKIYKALSVLYGDGFNDWHIAIEYSKKCIQLNIKELNPIFFINIACDYISIHQYDEALPFLSKAKIMAESRNDFYLLTFVYENYSNAFRLTGDFDKSLHYLNLALKTISKSYDIHPNRQEVIKLNCYIFINLVETYTAKKEYSKAREFIKQLRELSSNNNFIYGLDSSFLLEGAIEIEIKNYDRYLEVFDKALKLLPSSKKSYSNLDKWYKNLLFIYEERKEYQKALEVSKLIISNRDDHAEKKNEIDIPSFIQSKESEILELLNSNQEIQLQKEELEQFAYIVSHDLKTPLSNISNFAGLLLKKNRLQIDDESQEYIDTIIDSSQELTSMLTDLMNYVTLGKSEEKIQVCNLEEILGLVKQQIKAQLDSKKFDIVLHSSIDLNMSKLHLRQLLTNLILNAIKFTETDVTPKVDIYVKEDSLSSKIIVADNGIGIPDAHKKQVFQIFKRLHKNKFVGSGMGLAISKKIVESYGGRIWIESPESGGSEFHFTILKRSTSNFN